jgi:hypothetical protein
LATALLGLVVAILTGPDSVFRFGLRWQLQRHAAAELEAEGWEFLELSRSDAHKEHTSAFTLFLGRLEAMNEQIATTYLDIFRDTDKSPKKDPA